MSASALYPHIVLADARVHEDVINVLHVARVDPLIAGRDSARFAFVEAGVARQPLGEAVMHVALEGERSLAAEEAESKNVLRLFFGNSAPAVNSRLPALNSG